MKSTTLHPMEVAKRAGSGGGGGDAGLTERVETLENKVAGLEEYSTTEVDTGKEWIDGKRIYRRVFHVDNVLFGQSGPIAGTIDNLDTCVNISACTNGGEYRRPIGLWYPQAVHKIYVYIRNNNVVYEAGTGLEGQYSTLDIIVEYTKTE